MLLRFGILILQFFFIPLWIFANPSPERTDFEKRFATKVTAWAKVNTGSYNPQGLAKFSKILDREFQSLKCKTNWNLATRSFTAERKVKSPRLKVLMVAHLDTVFEAWHPFREVRRFEDPGRGAVLSGPGVSDDKAGIAMISEVIRAMAKSPFYSQIEWRVFIAADEEITSQYSKESLIRFAKGSDLNLVFEPGWWDENQKIPRLATSVGGNAHIEWTVKGVEAHSAIAFEKGRSAILALAKHIEVFESWSNPKENFLVNVAMVEGGGKLNVRPGSAKMKVSVRYDKPEDETKLLRLVQDAQKKFQADGIQVDYSIDYRWHPQTLATPALIESLQKAARTLGQPVPVPSLSLARSASAILAEAGMPALDSMGAFGSGYHSDQERLYLSSAYERLALVCELLLERLGGSSATIKP